MTAPQDEKSQLPIDPDLIRAALNDGRVVEGLGKLVELFLQGGSVEDRKLLIEGAFAALEVSEKDLCNDMLGEALKLGTEEALELICATLEMPPVYSHRPARIKPEEEVELSIKSTLKALSLIQSAADSVGRIVLKGDASYAGVLSETLHAAGYKVERVEGDGFDQNLHEAFEQIILCPRDLDCERKYLIALSEVSQIGTGAAVLRPALLNQLFFRAGTQILRSEGYCGSEEILELCLLHAATSGSGGIVLLCGGNFCRQVTLVALLLRELPDFRQLYCHGPAGTKERIDKFLQPYSLSRVALVQSGTGREDFFEFLNHREKKISLALIDKNIETTETMATAVHSILPRLRRNCVILVRGMLAEDLRRLVPLPDVVIHTGNDSALVVKEPDGRFLTMF